MKKNDEFIVEIIDNGIGFEGIAKLNDFVIFVPFAIKGEKVQIKIIKVNKKFAIGKIVTILTKSSHRADPECEVFGKCGSCSTMHIDYAYELECKKRNVINTFRKQSIVLDAEPEILGMGLPYCYRNKVSYPVRNIQGKNKMGFFRNYSHEIVEHKYCDIQNSTLDVLSKSIFSKLQELNFTAYNEKDLTGQIRHIVLRRGYHTEDILVTIVVTDEKLITDDRFKEIPLLDKDIKSVNINVNNDVTNEILGSKTVNIFGDEYITDYIGDMAYYISAKSFFQVNTIQAEILYFKLKEMLHLNKEDILFDLYSGVGSIGIFLSDSVKQVYGIEIIKEAVDMANLNIKRNNVNNCEYIAGSVEDKIVEFEERNIKPSVIVVDPPRRGLDEQSIQYILKFAPDKIGYVSCNYATLARDLKMLENYYYISDIKLVDLFPKTEHVEVVCVLVKK